MILPKAGFSAVFLQTLVEGEDSNAPSRISSIPASSETTVTVLPPKDASRCPSRGLNLSTRPSPSSPKARQGLAIPVAQRRAKSVGSRDFVIVGGVDASL